MDQKSPLDRARELEMLTIGILADSDITSLAQAEQKVIHRIKRAFTDARLDVRDYELAESRAEQEQYAVAARKRLDQLQKDILIASEHNLFSAIDVAQLSAQIQQVISDLN